MGHELNLGQYLKTRASKVFLFDELSLDDAILTTAFFATPAPSAYEGNCLF